MSRFTKNCVAMFASLAMVVSLLPAPQASALSVVPPAQGQLIGVCWNNAVHLFWGTHPNANSNSLQKGDMYPNDPNNFWGWVVQGHSGHSYVDYNVIPGVTYTYRVKYRPNLPSNEVTVTCPAFTPRPSPTPYPTPHPTPYPYPNLSCSPSYQSTDSGQWVTFSADWSWAQPAHYPYRQLTWRAVGGSPSSGTGTSFGTRFYTNSINETRNVTVSDGYRTATCTVYVRGERPAPLTITPYERTVNDGDSVSFYATGGTGHYTWSAPDTVPYIGTGSSWTLQFRNYSEFTKRHTVTVRSGGQSRSATVWVRPRPRPVANLNLTPMSTTVSSGELVNFRATGGTGYYTWSSTHVNGRYGATGSFWGLRFDNPSDHTRQYTVTVTSGSQSRTATVWVRPQHYWTPTPTPSPVESLSCWPADVWVENGKEVILHARGGTGHYTWSHSKGYADDGYGANYAVRFYNSSGYVRTHHVTVKSGYQTSTCRVHVSPASTSTPTPTPTPYGPDRLDLTQGGLNVSDGQISLSSSVRADGNETVQFVLTVRNTSNTTVHNVRATDLLPHGLAYIWGSTNVDGTVVSDGLTTSGINLGTFYAGQAKTVRFSAMVDPEVVPDWGTRELYNTAQVRGDGTDVEVSRLAVILGRSGVLPAAAGVNTGVEDSLLIALAVALAVTGLYAVSLGSARLSRAPIQKELNFAQ